MSHTRTPRGVFYERSRGRYRVRLYYCQRVVWRSYHTDPDEAAETLEAAREYRRELARTMARQPPPAPPSTITDLVE